MTSLTWEPTRPRPAYASQIEHPTGTLWAIWNERSCEGRLRDHNLYPEISTVRSAPWIQPSPRDLHHLSGWSAAQRFRSFQELACRPMGPTFIPRPAPPLWLGWNASLLFRAMACLTLRGLPSVNGPEGRSPRTRRGYASQTEPLIRPAIGKRNPKQSPLHIRGAEREPSLWVMELIAPRSAVLFVGAER